MENGLDNEKSGSVQNSTESNSKFQSESNPERVPNIFKRPYDVCDRTEKKEHHARNGDAFFRYRVLNPGLGRPDGEFETMRNACRLFNLLRGTSGRYLSDVIQFGDPQTLVNFANTLQRKFEAGRSRDNFLLLSMSDPGNNTNRRPHLHIIHDCAFSLSQSKCRCAYIKETEEEYSVRRNIRLPRLRPFSTKLSVTDWENILSYFNQGQQYIIYASIKRHLEGKEVHTEGIRQQRPEGCGPEESISEEQYLLHPELQFNNQRESGFPIGETSGRNKKYPRLESKHRNQNEGGLLQYVVELLKKNPTYPPAGLMSTKIWLSDPVLKFVNESNHHINNAFQYWNKLLCSYSAKDFFDMYSNKDCNFIFGSGFNSFDNYYYTIDESIDILDKLLYYQLHDDVEVKTFITDLYNVCERRVAKLNSFYVESEPSAGKNFFFDALLSFYQVIGHITILNRYNSFPFQDVADRRLVLWNEPDFCSDFFDILKVILGGDNTSVNVKYKPSVTLYRTPVIILTNKKISAFSSPAFIDRVACYTWYKAPYLKDYDKKPHPVAIYHIFKKYVEDI